MVHFPASHVWWHRRVLLQNAARLWHVVARSLALHGAWCLLRTAVVVGAVVSQRNCAFKRPHMAYTWLIYGWCMVHTWFVHGESMDDLWIIYGDMVDIPTIEMTNSLLWKIAMYSEFSHERLWFSIVMLKYHSVSVRMRAILKAIVYGSNRNSHKSSQRTQNIAIQCHTLPSCSTNVSAVKRRLLIMRQWWKWLIIVDDKNNKLSAIIM